MAVVATVPQMASEFIGTFLLVFTVGCNVLGGSATWAATSIACVLMVCIYSMGSVSGAHFNPAVTLAVTISKVFRKDPHVAYGQAAVYMAVQLTAGTLAAMSYRTLFGGRHFNLAPGEGFGWWEACLVELLYTFMLCFVVLNVATTKTSEGNQYYGIAIGFVIIAGGYAAGPISGAAFNPAVALGIDLSSAQTGFGWSIAYIAAEFIGAALAAVVYGQVHPEEYTLNAPVGLGAKCLSEFLGTFFLVLTVGLNVMGGSPAAAWSIAASLMCMIYALGGVSGAHFNPAVSLAIFLSGRNKFVSPGEIATYMVTQIVAGIVAGLTYNLIYKGDSFALAPGQNYGYLSAGVAEIIFTFLLCFVVLCVATSKVPSKEMFGLAIGSCVTVGGFAIGSISGGSLNPAVSFGIDVSSVTKNGIYNCLIYSVFEFAGAGLAAGAYYLTHPEEYEKGAASKKEDEENQSLIEKIEYGATTK